MEQPQWEWHPDLQRMDLKLGSQQQQGMLKVCCTKAILVIYALNHAICLTSWMLEAPEAVQRVDESAVLE